MRLLSSNRIAAAVVVGVVVLAWVRPSLNASPTQFGGGGMGSGGGGMGVEEEAVVPRVYFETRVTPEAAKLWSKLGQKVALKFNAEVTLSAFVQAVRTATVDKEMPEGLPIYIDPVGLMESEKTLDSPLMINLESIRLATGLELALKQLDLVYSVHPDGLLVITVSTDPNKGLQDPSALILDKLDALQKEVAKLRTEMGNHAPKIENGDAKKSLM